MKNYINLKNLDRAGKCQSSEPLIIISVNYDLLELSILGINLNV